MLLCLKLNLSMRFLLSSALLLACSAALAQQPPKLEPLPEPPPPPGAAIGAPGEEPVRITPGQNDQVEEFKIDGKRVIKVTQPDGKVYYLMEAEPGASEVRDGLGSRLRAPLWVIKEF
jgi:hypothetical protein